jgi:hypothetical protein
MAAVTAFAYNVAALFATITATCANMLQLRAMPPRRGRNRILSSLVRLNSSPPFLLARQSERMATAGSLRGIYSGGRDDGPPA